MRLPANAAFRPTPQGTIPPQGAGTAPPQVRPEPEPKPESVQMPMTPRRRCRPAAPNGRNSSPARESRAKAHVFVRFRNKMPIFAVDFP